MQVNKYRVRQEQWTCSELAKEYVKAVLLSPHLFNLLAKYIMQKMHWMKHKEESKLLGKMSINPDMQMTENRRGIRGALC